jgi:phosphate transport system substrate-binding protein
VPARLQARWRSKFGQRWHPIIPLDDQKVVSERTSLSLSGIAEALPGNSLLPTEESMRKPSRRKSSFRRSLFATALRTGALLLLPGAFIARSSVAAEQPSPVRKIFVDSMGTDHGAAEMRDSMIHRLQRTRNFDVVPDPKYADAAIRGAGRIWVTGHVTTNPRSHLSRPTFGGFLSVEVVGKNGETLWSYLVSASLVFWDDIIDDLAGQIVNRLVVAFNENQPNPPSATIPAQGHLKGAGATFPAPIYQSWFESFEERNPNLHISYDPVGSGEGLQYLKEGTVDFGASDMPLSDKAMEEFPSRLVEIPTVLGAVAIIYNVGGPHQSLNFTPETLSGIYLGRIRKWNDPEVRKVNRGALLPDDDIVVVHRSDGSGTSFAFTDYLSKISPRWKDSVGVGLNVAWPVGTAAERNEGVASAVQRTPNSIGYVEFIYAVQHEVIFAAVQNAAGLFVKPSISSVSDAAEGARGSGNDLRSSIVNAPGKGAYPISTYTWLLIPEKIEGADKKNAMTELLRWILTTGQKQCSALGYVPLPSAVAKHALSSIDASTK